MKIQRLPPSLLVLIQVALFSRTASALVVNAMDLHMLLPRDTCAGREGSSTCGQDLPENFCCSTGDNCIRLNNTGALAAALCCPKGSNCDSVNTIICDTKFQDPSQFPESPLHASDTSLPLPSCGRGCCPLGYECVSDGASCRIKDSTKQTQTSSATTTTSTPSDSTTSAPSQVSSTAASSQASATSRASGTSSPLIVEPQKTDDTNTAGLVLTGLLPGLLAGSAITLGVLFFLKKRQRQKRGYKSDTSSSFFGPPTPHSPKPPKISEPIYQPGMSDRVVFGHNRSASGNTIPDLVAGGYYKPNSDNRRTADSTTLVSPPESSAKKVHTLDPPFETPTKARRSAQRDQAKRFFSRSSSRTSRRNTQGTTHSMETISMTMGPPRAPSSYQGTPQVRQTTFSDVYRAAGISPSQVRSTRPSEDVPR